MNRAIFCEVVARLCVLSSKARLIFTYFTFLLMAGALFAATPAIAAPTCEELRSVTEWQADVQISASGNWTDNLGWKRSESGNARAHLRFKSGFNALPCPFFSFLGSEMLEVTTFTASFVQTEETTSGVYIFGRDSFSGEVPIDPENLSVLNIFPVEFSEPFVRGKYWLLLRDVAVTCPKYTLTIHNGVREESTTDGFCYFGAGGPPDLFAFEKGLPLPSAGLVFSGAASVTESDRPVTWTYTWTIKPAGPPKEKKLECASRVSGSIIAVENQSLGEAVDVVGTPFSLVYQSDRLPGRKDALWDARKQALGGWTLDALHAYDPAANALHLGNGTTRQADSLGTVKRVNAEYLIASESGAEIYAFDSTGRHLRTIDGLTNALRLRFAYDAAKRLVSVTDGNGKVTTIERTAAGVPTAIVSPFGKRMTLVQGAAGYLTKITNPAGEAHSALYAAGGLLTGFTNPRGIKTSYTYDAEGRLTGTTDAAGGGKALSRTEQADGRTVSVTTGMGRTTRYAAAWLPGNQEKRTVSIGGLTTTSIRVPGTLASSTSIDGTQISAITGLDPRWGKQASFAASETTVMPSGLTGGLARARTVQLGDASNPLSLTAQTDTFTIQGRTYALAYTAANRTAVLTTPMGRKRTATFDAQGRLARAVTGGVPVTFGYNPDGKLATMTEGAAPGRTSTFGYTAGDLTSITDPLGRKTTFALDKAGRPLSVTLPNGRSLAYKFDANGNLTSLSPPTRPAHAFAYTPVDLTASYNPPAVAPAGGPITYAYNKDRDITAEKHSDGRTLAFTYDAIGRLGKLAWTGGALSYAYDTAGRLATATGPGTGTVRYAYDGSLLLQTTWAGEVAGAVERTYDPEFRLASLAVNATPAMTFSYDGDSLLTKAGALALSRDTATGRLTGTTLGSVSETFTYNGFGEVVGYASRTGTAPLFATSVKRDAVGRITQNTETLLGKTTIYDYAYDAAGRLVMFKVGGVVRAQWQYDGNGNRIAVSGAGGTAAATYDAQDRLLTYTATDATGTRAAAYGYSGHGDLKTKQLAGKTTSYAYDPLGNLLSVALPDGRTIGYVIDGQGRRIGKKVNGALVRGFLYQDGLRPIAELGAGNQIVSRFVYGSRLNVPDYLVKGGVSYRILADHLGSPRLVVNIANGQVAQRIDYGPFGEVLLDTNPGFQPFGFAGGLYDPDTALVRFGARDYEAQTGRWTAKDPILFAGGDANLYGYVVNDPMNFIDNTGLNKRGVWESMKWYLGHLFAAAQVAVSEGKATDIGEDLVERQRIQVESRELAEALEKEKRSPRDDGKKEYEAVVSEAATTGEAIRSRFGPDVKELWKECADALAGGSEPTKPGQTPAQGSGRKLKEWKNQ